MDFISDTEYKKIYNGRLGRALVLYINGVKPPLFTGGIEDLGSVFSTIDKIGDLPNGNLHCVITSDDVPIVSMLGKLGEDGVSVTYSVCFAWKAIQGVKLTDIVLKVLEGAESPIRFSKLQNLLTKDQMERYGYIQEPNGDYLYTPKNKPKLH